ncbi:MAG: DoxX family protein [Bacteroidia bacterium]|nr:DoxX family protein [Bacteroidia bacterium]
MNSQSRFIKIITELSRIILGATFVFSGFVKAVDPLGFTYKIQDYLISFNLTELFPLALPVAIVLVVFEFLIGVFLLLGIYRKPTVILAAVFMAFFLPLTLWIALKNPVKDCGCFGDALIISNWETFYKNIVLGVCAVILLLYYKKITPLFSAKTAWIAAAFSIIFGFAFAIYNVVKLPVFDFRPYHIGANIPENMYIDPTKTDIVENVFIYSKDGVEQEFTEENYPWDDSTYTFVEMKTKLIKEGEKPKIEDFYISELVYDSLSQSFVDGEDITQQILSDVNYNFLMISYSLEQMNEKHLDNFKEASDFAENSGYGFYCLTSSSPDFIGEWSAKNNTDFQFAHADERVLKTMIRSNPGLMLLQNGNVINMWDDSEIPNFESRGIENLAKVEGLKTNLWGKLMVIFLIFLIPLLLIKMREVGSRKLEVRS